MDKIIYKLLHLNCNHKKAYKMFTVNKHLEKWLTRKADVEPKVSGKYELFWNLEDKKNDSTIGCKILSLAPNKYLCFEWKGPRHFKHFMNNVRPLTNVLVFFIPYPKFTEVHLLHTGWKETPAWEEARKWFVKVWASALSELKKYVEARKSGK